MMRSAFLKYRYSPTAFEIDVPCINVDMSFFSFQVRIGHMDGVMVTYHNTDEIFGFQYISRNEMDARLFGTSKMGDEAFKYSLLMMEKVFAKATAQHPRQVSYSTHSTGTLYGWLTIPFSLDPSNDV